MLLITVELVPLGVLAQKRTLGVMVIANDGTGTHESGNYTYTITEEGTPVGSGHIANFPRKRRTCWSLVKEVLAKALR